MKTNHLDDQQKPHSGLFFCIEQEPKPKELGLCAVSIKHNDIALLMDPEGKHAIRRMDRAQVDWMQAAGFMVSGYEHTGYTKTGKPIYRRQEWFCRYSENQ